MEQQDEKSSDGKSKQTRRGPAPFASFEDVSDEEDASKSPEPTQSESTESSTGPRLERGRSLSTPMVQPGHLTTPSTPRIDISRASSSSHHDSRDSSPEMALFADKDKDSKIELGFREEGALDLRSSTEELYFMEPNTAETEKEVPRPPSRKSPLMFASKVEDKSQQRHSRKDSATSDIFLALSGRQSRLSSIGSQGSAHSNISAQSNLSHISIHSHVSAKSRLSVISGVSRSPSPHKMLLETSFCGPKPIENEPDVSAEVSEERLMEIAGLPLEANVIVEQIKNDTPKGQHPEECEVDKERNNDVKVEINIENTKEMHERNQCKSVESKPEIKLEKEKINQQKAQDSALAKKSTVTTHKSGKSSRPEVYKSKNLNKEVIRIKLKPDTDDEDDESDKTITNQEVVKKPETLNLFEQSKKQAQHFADVINSERALADRKPSSYKAKLSGPALLTPNASPTSSRKLSRKDDSRTPSPAAANVSRKSSFCSLFKSKETVLSPDSPSNSMVTKRKSVNGGSSRSRSKSRDRSTTSISSGKAKGSMLSLFKTPKKGSSPNSRASSPQPVSSKAYVPPSVVPKDSEYLKYYSDAKNGVIHIPLHTPPDEQLGSSATAGSSSQKDIKFDEILTHEEALQKKQAPSTSKVQTKIIQRTVLPDGSIIIPLHSPTENNKYDSERIEEKKEICVSVETHPIREEKTPDEQSKQEQKTTTNPVTTTTVSSAEEPRRKKGHISFTTSVGSKEQLIFSTQFSITKTPSITSEYSDMFPPSLDSLKESKEDVRRREPLQPETHITTIEQQLSIESTPSIHKSTSELESAFGQEIKETKISCETQTVDLPLLESNAIEDAGDSSGSEMSSELGALKKNALQDIIAHSLGIEEAEKKGLVNTQDSFDDELPYVPTTLPQERSVAIPIIPIKERQSTGTRMHTIERPRSTTPIAPSCLEEYCAEEPKTPDNLKMDKLKISLPKDADKSKNGHARSRSPRRTSYGTRPKAWGEFAEQGLPNTPARKSSVHGEEKQPELPPRAPAKKPEWINFEEVPERRKMPKRIQTIPRHSDEADGVVYNYVNPEDCLCECHEATRMEKQEDEEPLLEGVHEQEGLSAPVASGDRRSLISDSSRESSCSNHEPCGTPAGLQVGHPFNMDLGFRSNRSSIASQDSVQAQDTDSPQNASRKF